MAREHDADVLVVGAGAAGLSCARQLAKAGKRVIVLEARDRIGGRVHTIRDRGVIEAGAEFIHGENAATWDIVRQEGLATEEWRPGASSFRYFSSGHGVRADSEALLSEMRLVEEGAYEYDGPDISYAEFLSQKPGSEDAHFFAARHIGDLEGADAHELSVRLLSSEDAMATNGARNFWVRDGYDGVIESLARDLDVRLNHNVTRVEWSEGSVRALCANGVTVHARRLVFTLPVGVLRTGHISFVPELPTTFRGAVKKIGFGNNTKLVLWLNERTDDFGMLDTSGYFGHFWPRMFGDEQVIVGYSGGSRADELVSMGKDAAVESGISELAGALGAGIRSNIVRAEHFTWSDDPFALGSYSYSRVGMDDARGTLRAPVVETLYYTGEATNARGHTATVHGAIEAGRDTANEILKN